MLVLVVLAWGLARRPASVDGIEASGPSRLVIGGGVVLPTIVISIVFAATIHSLRSLSADPGASTVTIDVTGHQWWWEVRYDEQQVVTANEVHIPAGEQVALRLRSADVIHSFWVPALAGKLDLLPERTNTLHISADEPGRYRGQCAEFCGLQHTNMGVVVVAHDPADFAAWMERQRADAVEPDTELARAGRDLFLDKGCSSCHTISGTPATGDRGPDLTHLADRPLIGGGVLESSGDDLRQWIRDPHDVKDGVLMPSLDLTDDEVEAIATYLETLR